MVNILVVEDDMQLNRSVCTYLNDHGFEVKGCLNAQDAYDAMYSGSFEMIISDIMMPEVNGFEFAKNIRNINKTLPIMFMSAKEDMHSKQKGYQIGIDDYMVKPINLEEMVLRINALLRRSHIENEKKLLIGNLLMNADAMAAYVNEEELSLTTREFNILFKMLSYPSKTFSRLQLMNAFWDVDTDSNLRAVDVYITKLRDKLSFCNGFKIVTVRGLGYKAVLNNEKK